MPPHLADPLAPPSLARLFGGMTLVVLMVLVANQEQRRLRQRLERQKQRLERIVAALAAALQRRGEMVARCGGEEFVVVLPGLQPDAVAAVGERLRRCVIALELPHADGGAEGIVTISIGLATAVPAGALVAEDLLAAADAQLYAAKSGGRNRVGHRQLQRSL